MEQTLTNEKTYLSVLCSICQDIISEFDYTKILSSLVEDAAGCLNAKAASVRLLDRSGQVLELAAVHGLSKNYLEKGMVEVAKSPIDIQVLQGRIVQIKDLSEDDRFQYPSQAEEEGIKSVISVPLQCQDRTLGVLRIYSENQRVFDNEEVTFLKTLAFQGAAAIRNSQRYQRLKNLNRIGKAVTSKSKIQEITYLICQCAAEELSAKGSTAMLIDQQNKQLEMLTSYNLSEEFISKGSVEADTSIINCLKSGDIVVTDPAEDKRMNWPQQIEKEGIKSVVCIPFKLHDKVLGALSVYTPYKYQPSTEDSEFLSTLADFCVIAMENARLYDHIKRDYEDLKTDVWNWYGWGERPPHV